MQRRLGATPADIEARLAGAKSHAAACASLAELKNDVNRRYRALGMALVDGTDEEREQLRLAGLVVGALEEVQLHGPRAPHARNLRITAR